MQQPKVAIRYYEEDCACVCNILRVERFLDLWYDDKHTIPDREIHMSIYTRKSAHNHTIWCCWKWKLKMIWNVITEANPHKGEGDVTLPPETARKLAHDLIDLVEMPPQ